jgi:unsaturated rhamnogalacturonyl hydrolase
MYPFKFILRNCFSLIYIIIFLSSFLLIAQNKVNNSSKQMLAQNDLSLSKSIADLVMKKYPDVWQIDGGEKPKWDYKAGYLLSAFDQLYQKTGDENYLRYIKTFADALIDKNGEILTYTQEEYNIDLINPGKILFTLYNQTKDERYRKALSLLKKQLENQPRTMSNGFWHKKIYPNQMWLDGLFMAEPFYTQFTVTFENGKYLDDIVNQYNVVQNHFIDKNTGLLYHAWDESKQMGWANPNTGTSPSIWSRGMGWYLMSLVDVLDHFPKNHPKRKMLLNYLNTMAKSLLPFQSKDGLWYQVTNLPNHKDNYQESSASAMIIYAFAKGAKKGYLSSKYKKLAQTAFHNFIPTFVKYDANGAITLMNTSPNIGLGGNPYRDGSQNYYLNSTKKENSSIGLTSFLLSAIELNQ